MSNRAIFTWDGDSFTWSTPYIADLVQDLKDNIPYSGKKWNHDAKVWTINGDHFDKLHELSLKYGLYVEIVGKRTTKGPSTHEFKLDYMGLVHKRPDNTHTASGWVNGFWNAVFTLPVLQDWFNFTDQPGVASTPYTVLSLDSALQGLAFEKALKKAYRRAAKAWHPDRNKEDGAELQFKKINEAYEQLKDPLYRRRLDAGTKFENLSTSVSTGVNEVDWRPPIRCGNLTITGTKLGDQYDIQKILAWEDILDPMTNLTLIAYWKPGDETFTSEWR